MFCESLHFLGINFDPFVIHIYKLGALYSSYRTQIKHAGKWYCENSTNEFITLPGAVPHRIIKSTVLCACTWFLFVQIRSKVLGALSVVMNCSIISQVQPQGLQSLMRQHCVCAVILYSDNYVCFRGLLMHFALVPTVAMFTKLV